MVVGVAASVAEVEGGNATPLSVKAKEAVGVDTIDISGALECSVEEISVSTVLLGPSSEDGVAVVAVALGEETVTEVGEVLLSVSVSRAGVKSLAMRWKSSRPPQGDADTVLAPCRTSSTVFSEISSLAFTVALLC